MGQPAARVGDMHICPMFDGPKPHVGGLVLPLGVPTVLIGGLPAATVGTLCVCVSAPDTIVQGSFSVKIGGRQAARLGDRTAHGGMVTTGCPTVLIGDFGMGAGVAAVINGVVSLESRVGFTADTSRKKIPPNVIASAATQISTAIAAAQAGSPFMEKC